MKKQVVYDLLATTTGRDNVSTDDIISALWRSASVDEKIAIAETVPEKIMHFLRSTDTAIVHRLPRDIQEKVYKNL